MSRDVITVGSTMRIPLLSRGEYSQWRERFMNYLEEQTDGEAMINSIQNGDQPLPVIAQVSLAGNAQNAPPTLKDPKQKIDEQEILFEKMSRQLVEMNNNMLRFQEKILEKETKISELEGCVSNKDVEIEKCLERLNASLEIEKFKRATENKIEFAYDYGNLNASYVNEKIIFLDDYFQEIINPDFEKIDSLFQQTSSLKPYVPNVILEKTIIDLEDEVQTSSLKPYVLNVILKKIIIDLEDEVVNLLEKEKVNLETIESLKSKAFESSENVSSESENQRENDCLVVEKECDKEENPKVTALEIFKLNVSQCVSPISMSKSSCDSNNVEIKLKERDIVQICLWIIDSGCSKHTTGNRALLMNFVENFLGTVRFVNNDFAVIAGYGDVVIGSMTIKKVYYVEGLGHNLFSVGQFCDRGLEVAFRKSACFVRNEDVVDLLTGDRSSNLYTIALNKVASNSSTCLLAKAFSSQSWLWHQRLSHLNFATINNLVKNNLVQGHPKMKFEKDHLCSACEQGKIHWKHHKSKTAFASNKPLYLLHMDLCGPMRVQSINGKRYM
nr:integrase, catalytic region, zinc finger, CCHC-type, peptidase aspartic, catalytic [Tanacetum cinerariifolium]